MEPRMVILSWEWASEVHQIIIPADCILEWEKQMYIPCRIEWCE